MCPPQGMPTPEMTRVPTAPYRPPPKPNTGHRGLDAVAEVALKVRTWLRAEQLPLTVDALAALTGLALREQRRIDDAAKRGQWEEREGAGTNVRSSRTNVRPPAARKRVATVPAKKEPSHDQR